MGGIGKVVSNIASKVADGLGKVANIAGKAVNILKAPEEAIGGFVKGAAGKLLDKLPVIGPAVKPFVDKLVDSGISMLSKGPLGTVFEMAKKLAPKAEQLADFAETVGGAMKKVGANAPEAMENMQETFSFSQAQGLAERYAA